MLRAYVMVDVHGSHFVFQTEFKPPAEADEEALGWTRFGYPPSYRINCRVRPA